MRSSLIVNFQPTPIIRGMLTLSAIYVGIPIIYVCVYTYMYYVHVCMYYYLRNNNNIKRTHAHTHTIVFYSFSFRTRCRPLPRWLSISSLTSLSFKSPRDSQLLRRERVTDKLHYLYKRIDIQYYIRPYSIVGGEQY